MTVTATRAPSAAARKTRPCTRCRCIEDAHEHYRDGAECACGRCPRFTTAPRWLLRLGQLRELKRQNPGIQVRGGYIGPCLACICRLTSAANSTAHGWQR